MELNFGLIRQLARTFLQQSKRVAIVALLEQNPAQRIGYVRLVRGSFFRLLRQVVCLIKLSEMFGIENCEIIESQRKIWRDGEQLSRRRRELQQNFSSARWIIASCISAGTDLFFSTKALSFSIACSCLFEAT